MKDHRPNKLFLITLLFFPLFLKSQIQYETTDYAQINEGHTISITYISQNSGLDFDTSGNGITWDFSSLTSSTQWNDTLKDPDFSPYFNKFINNCKDTCFTLCKDTCTSGPLACNTQCNTTCDTECDLEWQSLTNLSRKLSDTLDLGVVKVVDMYQYLLNNGNSLQQTMLGYKIVEPQSGLSIKDIVEYEKTDSIYIFPVQPNSSSASLSRFEIGINLEPFMDWQLSYRHEQKRTNSGEGWGTLITPYGSFDSTIKIKTIIHTFDTLEWNDTTYTLSDLLGEENAPDSIVQYQWLHPAFGLPLLTVNGIIINGKEILAEATYIDNMRCNNPVALFSSHPPLKVYFDSTGKANIDFLNYSFNTDSFLWDFGDNSNLSSLEEPSHTYITEGTYKVTLIAWNTSDLCSTFPSDTLSISLRVIDSTNVTADFYATPPVSCTRDTIRFFNFSTRDTVWYWNFGDPSTTNDTSTLENPQYFYTQPDTYSVMLIAYNSTASDTLFKNVIVKGAASVTSAGKDKLICKGDTIQLSPDFTTGGQENYFTTWSPATGLQDPADAFTTAYPDSSQTYYFELRVTLGACDFYTTIKDSLFLSVSDKPAPEAGFDYLLNAFSLTVKDLSVNSDSILWNFGDGSINSGDTTTYNYSNPGIYSVKQFVYNDCGMDSAVQTITVTDTSDGIRNNMEKKVFIYPNPVSDHLIIEFKDSEQVNGRILIYDLPGKEIAKFKIENKRIMLDGKATFKSNGIYLVKVFTEEGFLIKKIHYFE